MKRAPCINSEKSTSTTTSASTTIASTSSLKCPRAPVSEMTAAVIVGEKLTTMTTNSAIIVSLARPVACGATGSHGQAIQATANSPAIATPSVTAVIRRDAGGPLPEPFED